MFSFISTDTPPPREREKGEEEGEEEKGACLGRLEGGGWEKNGKGEEEGEEEEARGKGERRVFMSKESVFVNVWSICVGIEGKQGKEGEGEERAPQNCRRKEEKRE